MNVGKGGRKMKRKYHEKNIPFSCVGVYFPPWLPRFDWCSRKCLALICDHYLVFLLLFSRGFIHSFMVEQDCGIFVSAKVVRNPQQTQQTTSSSFIKKCKQDKKNCNTPHSKNLFNIQVLVELTRFMSAQNEKNENSCSASWRLVNRPDTHCWKGRSFYVQQPFSSPIPYLTQIHVTSAHMQESYNVGYSVLVHIQTSLLITHITCKS